MRVSRIIYEDFSNYKVPSMFIGTISCSGKCYRERNLPPDLCQNSALVGCEVLNIDDEVICTNYVNNPLTSAVVFGGLEPFDQFEEMIQLVHLLRKRYWCDDPIVIYTGYYKKELHCQLAMLGLYPNIIIKFGRYDPDLPPRFDDVLGVQLASNNQYAEKIS